MNDKFYELPEEKQQRIINAGFRVFSRNSYKKSPVAEIALEAGISKSLLFHYFRNKKELYLFLWEKCGEITIESLKNSGCYETTDVFDALFLSLKAKIALMRDFPDMGNFAIRAYYEKDQDVVEEIHDTIMKIGAFKETTIRLQFDTRKFVPGLDVKMMYREMFLASEGFVWEKMQRGIADPDRMEKEFYELICFWKSIYLRREEE